MTPTAPDGYVLIPEAAFMVFCAIVVLACLIAFCSAVDEFLNDQERDQ